MAVQELFSSSKMAEQAQFRTDIAADAEDLLGTIQNRVADSGGKSHVASWRVKTAGEPIPPECRRSAPRTGHFNGGIIKH